MFTLKFKTIVLAALLAWVVLSPLTARADTGDTNYFQQAVDASNRQDFQEAIRCYTVYLDSHPTDDEAYNNRGNAYRQTNQYQEALQDYSKAIELNPSQRYSFENRGKLYYYDLFDLDHALKDYSQQIALYPNDTSALTERGSDYLDLWEGGSDSFLTLAMADLNRAIALDSSYAPAWDGRGRVFRQQEMGDSAIESYSRAIDLAPEEVSYYQNRALQYELGGQNPLAIDDYSSIIDLESTNTSAYESRARLDVQVHDYPSAIQDFTKLIALDSTENPYYFGRAEAYRANKQPDLALRDYGLITRRDPQNAGYRLSRADCYSERGQYDSATADYTSIIGQQSNGQSSPGAGSARGAAFRNRGRAYLARGQYDPAIEDFTNYLTLAGDSGSADSTTPVLYWRGQAYAGRGEADLAIRDYSKVVDAFESGSYAPAAAGETSGSRTPDSVVIGACFNRAGIHRKRGEFDDARYDYGQVIGYDGKNLPARAGRAVLDYYAEDYDSASEDCSVVIDATAQPDAPYYTCSGIQSIRSGDYSRAGEFFSKGLAVSSHDLDLLNLRGDAYFHAGRADSALADWRLANSLDARYPTFAAARETLGLSLDLAYPRSYMGVLLDEAEKAVEAQNYPEALRLANQQIQKYPKDANGYMFRMSVHLTLNDFDEALADVQAYSALSPDSGPGNLLFGVVYSLRQEWDSAVAYLDAGLRQPGGLGLGDLPELLLGYGNYCLGSYEQAVQAFDRIPLSGGATDSAWMAAQALAYLAEGDTASAVRDCRSQPDDPLSRMILNYRAGRLDSVVRIGRPGVAALESTQAALSRNTEGLVTGLRTTMSAAPMLELEGDAWARMRRPDSARACWAEAHRLSAALPIDQAGRNALGLGPGGQPSAIQRPVARPIQAPPQPLLPAPSVFASGRPNGYALVIGLSKYQSVPPPKYGSEDAQAFAEFVAGEFGVARDKTEILLDDRATVGTIRGELIDWLAKKHGFKVIYFAGHGVPDPEDPREGDVYLLPYDGNPDLKSTLISLKDVAELGTNEGDTVLLFLDACFSGAGEGRTASIASRPLVVAKLSETEAVTMAAAEGTQPSKEFERAQHGYFTYYTLLGLKGAADKPPYGNDDGWVTTTELYKYVKDKVSDATNEVQVPVFRPEREIRLGRYR